MKQQKKITKQNGITLISLVITIVIMLILAGVAISITVGDGSVTQHAENAAEKWGSSVANEQIKIDEALSYLPGSSPNDLPEGWDSTKVADVVEDTANNRKAPIPVGYTASQISTEDEIKEGLVIYQTKTAVTGNPNSDEHITAMEGINQYVWIPVDDINDMIMCKSNGSNKKIDGTTATEGGKTTCELDYNVTKTNEIACKVHGYDSSITLTDTNIDTTGLGGRLYGTDSASTDTETPYTFTTNMVFTQASKAAHRFKANSTDADSQYREPDLVTDYDNSNYQLVLNESSQALGSANALKYQLNNKFIEMAKSVAKYGGFYISRYEPGYENSKVISKKNKAVLTASPSTSGNEIAGNRWYGLYNKTLNNVEKDASVNSHMIWGCQYDQVIKFLGPEKGETAHDYQTTSQVVTGYTGDQDILNNIYDLEGNNLEGTAQADGTSYRVSRGSYCSTANRGRFFPASDLEGSDYPTSTFAYCTARPTLTVAL